MEKSLQFGFLCIVLDIDGFLWGLQLKSSDSGHIAELLHELLHLDVGIDSHHHMVKRRSFVEFKAVHLPSGFEQSVFIKKSPILSLESLKIRVKDPVVDRA